MEGSCTFLPAAATQSPDGYPASCKFSKQLRHSWRGLTVARDNDCPFQVLSKLFRPNLPLPERRRLRLANLDDGPVPYQRQRGRLVRFRSGQYKVVVPVYQNADHAFSSLQPRVSNRVTDCKLVDDLS